MAITDTAAIKYSNEVIRPMCDRIVRVKFEAEELVAIWGALAGTADEKLALLHRRFHRFCVHTFRTARLAAEAELLWDSLSLAPLFPNDPAEIVHDAPDGSGPDPNRPGLSGQDVRRIKNRIEEFDSYFGAGTDLDKQWVSTPVLPITFDYLKHVVRMTDEGGRAPTGGWAGTIVNGRCADILQQYNVDAANKFEHLLRGSVSP